MFFILLIYTLCVAVSAHLGIDISSAGYTPQLLSCFRDNGYEFGIVRGYRDCGKPDDNAATSMRNLWAANFTHVDVYLFPCFHCRTVKSAAAQVQELHSALKTWGVDYGMIWLDIEGNWARPNYEENKAFFLSMLEGAVSTQVKFGIYSSLYMWENIFGDLTWDVAKQYPLWYAHYDGDPSFKDFKPFAGWETPHIKQFSGDHFITPCSTKLDVDKDWYP